MLPQSERHLRVKEHAVLLKNNQRSENDMRTAIQEYIRRKSSCSTNQTASELMKNRCLTTPFAELLGIKK